MRKWTTSSENSNAYYGTVMGDFNAKVGPGEIRDRLIWYSPQETGEEGC